MASYRGPKKELLFKIIEEMNDVLGFAENGDAIPTKDVDTGEPLTNQALFDFIQDDAETVVPDDKESFSEDVWEVLCNLNAELTCDSDDPDAQAPESKPDKAPAKKKKKAPAKKKDLFENPSACTFIMMQVCKDPEIKNEDIATALEAAGKKASQGTISLAASDARKQMRYLKKIGTLK